MANHCLSIAQKKCHSLPLRAARYGGTTTQTVVVLALIAIGVVAAARSLATMVGYDLASTAGGIADPAALVGKAGSHSGGEAGSGSSGSGESGSGSGGSGESGGGSDDGSNGGSSGNDGSGDDNSSGDNGGSDDGGDDGGGGGLCP
jgi:hypothetical protein